MQVLFCPRCSLLQHAKNVAPGVARCLGYAELDPCESSSHCLIGCLRRRYHLLLAIQMSPLSRDTDAEAWSGEQAAGVGQFIGKAGPGQHPAGPTPLGATVMGHAHFLPLGFDDLMFPDPR